MKVMLVAVCLGLAVAGCSHRSSSSIEPSSTASATKLPSTRVSEIILTQEDITDRPYETLGDIEVSVSKTTIFNSDPTPEMIDKELREEAAEMGADAVILIRYGSVGISAFSWGALEGKGRAVRFVE